MSNLDHMKFLEDLAVGDVETLKVKERIYNASWKKRGGIGAFFVMARKWDALENLLHKRGDYDIVWGAVEQGEGDGTVIEQIRDLRRYLLLIECEALLQTEKRGFPTDTSLGAPRTVRDAVQTLKPLPHTGIGAYGEMPLFEQPMAVDPVPDPALPVPHTAEMINGEEAGQGMYADVRLGSVYRVFGIGSDFVRIRDGRNNMVWLPKASFRLNYNNPEE